MQEEGAEAGEEGGDGGEVSWVVEEEVKTLEADAAWLGKGWHMRERKLEEAAQREEEQKETIQRYEAREREQEERMDSLNMQVR